jgi:hypothetical protein
MRPRRRCRSTEDARISEGYGTEAGLGRPFDTRFKAEPRTGLAQGQSRRQAQETTGKFSNRNAATLRIELLGISQQKKDGKIAVPFHRFAIWLKCFLQSETGQTDETSNQKRSAPRLRHVCSRRGDGPRARRVQIF